MSSPALDAAWARRRAAAVAAERIVAHVEAHPPGPQCFRLVALAMLGAFDVEAVCRRRGFRHADELRRALPSMELPTLRGLVIELALDAHCTWNGFPEVLTSACEVLRIDLQQLAAQAARAGGGHRG